MHEFIEIDGPSVKARPCEHESGKPMIEFSSFFPSDKTSQKISDLFEATYHKLGLRTSICRIQLDPGQIEERIILEALGFVIDGFEYGIKLSDLSEVTSSSKKILPSGYSVRKMSYQKDIEVVALEKTVHAADTSTRVNFETVEAIESMRRYYQRTIDKIGVYHLMKDARVAGVLGFQQDRQHPKTVHISSVAIDLVHQGKGLFFPFLCDGFSRLDSGKYEMVSGVTTTGKIMEWAEKHSVKPVRLSLCRST